MSWVRLHTPPRHSRQRWSEELCGYAPLTARQEYYRRRSYERYLKTPDGQYMQEAMKNLDGTIGRIDSVRFVA
jgi:hypothetical protein